jgi:hypothetical protein
LNGDARDVEWFVEKRVATWGDSARVWSGGPVWLSTRNAESCRDRRGAPPNPSTRAEAFMASRHRLVSNGSVEPRRRARHSRQYLRGAEDCRASAISSRVPTKTNAAIAIAAWVFARDDRRRSPAFDRSAPRDVAARSRDPASRGLAKSCHDRDVVRLDRPTARHDRHVACLERRLAQRARRHARHDCHVACLDRRLAKRARRHARHDRHVACLERRLAQRARRHARHDRTVARLRRPRAQRATRLARHAGRQARLAPCGSKQATSLARHAGRQARLASCPIEASNEPSSPRWATSSASH